MAQRATVRFLALALVSAIDLFCFSAVADVIELKTGQRVEGAFKQATSRAVSIEVGGQTITFTRDKVRAIYFGSASNVASQPSPRDEALRALKGVQSAVEGGISYRDYTPRVTDAKIVVDRYLDGGKSDLDAAKAPIAAAMGYYTLASNAWSVKISVAANGGMSDVNNEIETAKLGLDLLIKDCPTAQAEIQSNRKSDSYAALSVSNRASSDGFALALAFSSLWPCASNKIADAEKALDGK